MFQCSITNPLELLQTILSFQHEHTKVQSTEGNVRELHENMKSLLLGSLSLASNRSIPRETMFTQRRKKLHSSSETMAYIPLW